jgi:hypothetical protein
MSDSENPDPKPTPSKQTSSVPLKKETVRVTLKAADAPMAPPPAVAGDQGTAAAPPAPSVPKPPTAQAGAPTPAPTIPLKTAAGTAPTKPAPTIKLATPTGAGAPTIQLKSPTAPAKPPAEAEGGAPTQPGGQSVQLPKATVQLQPTQPLSSAGAPSMSQAATIRTEDDEEEEGADTIAVVLSILGFVAAIAVLGFQIMTASIWVDGEWDRLIQ